MSPSESECSIHLIDEKISKNDTTFKKAISVQERLALTLRFLASGNSYVSPYYLLLLIRIYKFYNLPESTPLWTLSQKPRKKNLTTLQTCTTRYQRIMRNEKMGQKWTQLYFIFTSLQGQEIWPIGQWHSAYLTRSTFTLAQAVTVTSLRRDGKIPTSQRTSP
jgi:hypothetical protein